MLTASYHHACHGDDNQILEVELLPGQTIHAENGSMSYMDASITMRTGTGNRAGILTLFKRKTAGEDILLSIFTNDADTPAKLGFSPPQPSRILNVQLLPDQPDIICQRRSYLAGHPDVCISMTTAPARTAAFASANLFMQRLYGQGEAFLTANGAIIHKVLEPGQTYLTEPAAVLAFEDSIEWGVKTSSNLANIIWSKEKFFILSLKGPGQLWIQSTATLDQHIKRHIASTRQH